jgi:pSer/pThr/pTyr-binding forkhead associated (FHA) protein/RNA polymerase subunit RPABC4/transcription elongation factor Spt4
MDVGLVCERCDTFNPMASSACATCGSPLSLGDGHRPPTTPPAGTPLGGNGAAASPASLGAALPGSRVCKQCQAVVQPGYKFCGVCGAKIDAGKAIAPRLTAPFGQLQQQRAKLVLIKGDGQDGVSYTLAGEEHIAGRVEGSLLFPDDPFLSPRHANFYYKERKLWLHDERSANGVYVRIRQPAPLVPGDLFLVGEQVIRIEATPPETAGLGPDDDGTYVFASPRRASRMRLVQLLRGGDLGVIVRASGDTVTLGREQNDINFPDDPFISARHAEVSIGDASAASGQVSAGPSFTLTDLGSKNGTFVRMTRDTQLSHGDYVFMGQQLLRVEIV